MFSSSRKDREIPIRLSLSNTSQLTDRNFSPKFKGQSSATATDSAIEKSTNRLRQGVSTAALDYVPNFGCKFRDNVRRIDYILVYVEKEEEQQSKDEKHRESVRNYFEKKLQQDGVDIEVDRIKENDGETLVFVKLHATWSALCRYAERLQMKCPLWLRDKPNINADSAINSRSLWIKKFSEIFNHFKEKLFGLEEYDYSPANRNEETVTNQSARRKWRQKSFVINWPFKQKHVKRFAIRSRDTFFTEQQRLEIVYEILERAPIDPDRPKRRGLSALLENDTYECAYPLHDGDVNMYGHETKPTCNRQWLKLFWASWKRSFQMQPLLQIRNYFGEKIGFYYVFMDCYTSMLIYPSLAGMATLIIGLAQNWNSAEVKALCEQHEPSPNHISNFWMCPICEPPACEAWLMKHEGCFQYTWSYVIDNSWSLFLSVFIMLWAIIFLKVWRRREARVAVEWCTEDVAEQDFTIRPNYEERSLHVIQNPVTGALEPHIPLTRRCLWIGVSLSATLLMVIFACLCLMILVLSRIALYGALKKWTGFVADRNVECSRWLVHGLIFIVVLLLEKAYDVLAHKLTIFECPKTQSKFMTSLLWKIFVFQLLNDFVPIAYAAWMKGKTVNSPLDMKFLDELCDGGCLGEVTELIAVLLLARLIFGNISEVGIPFLKNAIKNFLHRNVMDDKKHTKSVPQFLKDFHLNEVELDGVYDEYMEMMIQFAFIVLFIPALPASAFVCFLNNIAEIRVDAINMLLSYRRPLPIRAPGIGIWNQFLDVIIKSGVICNAALLAFTSDIIPRFYYAYMINPNRTVTGFTRFSLNRLPIDGYIRNNEHHVDFHASLKKQNVSDCWYPDYSYSSRFEEHGSDFDTIVYWQILSWKMILFGGYVIGFYTIMYLINTFVSNVPESVIMKRQRRAHLVAKMFETDWQTSRASFDNRDTTIKHQHQQ